MLFRSAIDRTEAFFQSLGIATKLSEYNVDTAGIEQRAADQLKNYGWTALGEHKDITPSDVEKILEMSL